jgi:hypothetical protein
VPVEEEEEEEEVLKLQIYFVRSILLKLVY